MKSIFCFVATLILFTHFSKTDEISQWRGPNRNGIYQESNLLKSWPESGPDLLWSLEGIGEGYSSVTIKKKYDLCYRQKGQY